MPTGIFKRERNPNMKTRNRLLAAILTLVIFVSMLPVSAFAKTDPPVDPGELPGTGEDNEQGAPVKEGFVFDGMYEDVTCTATVDFATPVTNDAMLYASWTENAPAMTKGGALRGGNTKGGVEPTSFNIKITPVSQHLSDGNWRQGDKGRLEITDVQPAGASTDGIYFSCDTTTSYYIKIDRNSGEFTITGNLDRPAMYNHLYAIYVNSNNQNVWTEANINLVYLDPNDIPTSLTIEYHNVGSSVISETLNVDNTSYTLKTNEQLSYHPTGKLLDHWESGGETFQPGATYTLTGKYAPKAGEEARVFAAVWKDDPAYQGTKAPDSITVTVEPISRAKEDGLWRIGDKGRLVVTAQPDGAGADVTWFKYSHEIGTSGDPADAITLRSDGTFEVTSHHSYGGNRTVVFEATSTLNTAVKGTAGISLCKRMDSTDVYYDNVISSSIVDTLYEEDDNYRLLTQDQLPGNHSGLTLKAWLYKGKEYLPGAKFTYAESDLLNTRFTAVWASNSPAPTKITVNIQAVKKSRNDDIWRAGDTGKATMTVEPSNASTNVIWRSGNSDYVSMDADGSFTILKDAEVGKNNYFGIDCTSMLDNDVTGTASLYLRGGKAYVTGVKLMARPTKLLYEVGETFDFTGMVVELTYNDGDTVESKDGEGFFYLTSGNEDNPPFIATDTSVHVFYGKYFGEGTGQINIKVQVEPPSYFEHDVEVIAGSNGTASANPASAKQGTQIHISATPDNGYEVDKITWETANITATDITRDGSFTMPAEKVTVNVRFAEKPTTYTVSVFCDTAQGSVTGGGTYTEGESVTVQATANEGYAFSHWRGAERPIYEASYTFNVADNVSLTAYFAKAVELTVAADPAGGGTVTGSGIYAAGRSAEVTATANEGYYFIGWYEGENQIIPVSTEAEYIFTVTANTELTARFANMVASEVFFSNNRDYATFEPGPNDKPNGYYVQLYRLPTELTVQFTLPENTRFDPLEDCVFLGWKYGQDETLYQPGDTITLSLKIVWGQPSDLGTIYAIFGRRQSVTLSFIANELSVGAINSVKVPMAPVLVKEAHPGEGITYQLPQPGFEFNEDGYTFLHYRYNFTENGRQYLPGDTISIVDPGLNVYAMYTKKQTHTVRFMDGATELFHLSAVDRSRVQRPLFVPQKNGYAFDDWYADEDFQTPFEFAGEGGNDNYIVEDTLVYAKFKQATKITDKYGNDLPEITVDVNKGLTEYFRVRVFAQDSYLNLYGEGITLKKGAQNVGSLNVNNMPNTRIRWTLSAEAVAALGVGRHTLTISYQGNDICAPCSANFVLNIIEKEKLHVADFSPTAAEANKPYTVSGRILDESDDPVAGLKVQVLNQVNRSYNATTDTYGRFTVLVDRDIPTEDGQTITVRVTVNGASAYAELRKSFDITFFTPAPQPGALEADQAGLSFGTAQLNYDAISPKIVTLTNNTGKLIAVQEPSGAVSYEAKFVNQSGQPFDDQSPDLSPGESIRLAVHPKSGLAAGSYSETLNIAYTDGDKDDTVYLQISFAVTEKAVADIFVKDSNIVLIYGEKNFIEVTTDPEWLNVTFIPNDDGVVEADKNGRVTALKVGVTTITIRCETDDLFGETTATVTVKPRGITEKDFTALPTEAKVYNGEPQTQAVTSSRLKEGIDYEIEYENNISAGAASYTITGKGNYTGTIKAGFTINPLDASDFQIFIEPVSAVYNQKPWTFVADMANLDQNKISVAVAKHFSSVPLESPRDFTLSWSESTKVGTVTVTATMQGNYTGTIKGSFIINKATPTLSVPDMTVTYTGYPVEHIPYGMAFCENMNLGVLGSFAFKAGELVTDVAHSGEKTVVFTPYDKETFTEAETTLMLTIKKASAPSAIAFPTASDITYGQALADSVLTGGSTEYGTFAWENPSIVPDAGTAGYGVVFTPSAETVQNYEPISDAFKKQTVSVTVAKATVTYTVTYVVVNGTWADGTTANKTEDVEEGQNPANVPTGMQPAENCEGGAWNAVPAGVAITGNTTFTYTFTASTNTTYAFTKGDIALWTKGSAGTLDFTVTGIPDDSKTFAAFTGIEVNGVSVADGNYTATPGSVNISLKSAYLEGLAAGNHTITARFVDGNVQSKFIIRDQKTPDPVYNFKFTFTKKWQGGHEDRIDWVMYYPDGTVSHKKFNKKIVSENEWCYEAWFANGEDYYIIEKPIDGYIVLYENVGAHAGETDRCYNGGTIINYKMPQTGDDVDLALWFGCALASLVLLSLSIHAGKRKKAHSK